MREFPLEKKQIDDIVLSHGSKHQEALQRIADKIKKSFDDRVLFSPEAQQSLDAWASEHADDVEQGLRSIYRELTGLQSTKAPGHELSHLLNNLDSAVRMFEEYGDFSEAEKVEVVLSCLGHDLGRYVEESLDAISHRDTELLMPALVGRQVKAVRSLPAPLQQRILYDIGSAVQAKTGHRTADAVHQADREQLLGSTMLARDLAFGANVGNIEFTVPLKEELRTMIPGDEIDDYMKEWHFLVQKESYMRTIYPATSPDGGVVQQRNIRENAVMLMLATHENEEAFEQVFAPETGSVYPSDVSSSKKAIDQTIFDAALREKETFLESMDLNKYEQGSELQVMHDLLATDKVVPPEGFDGVITAKLNKCSRNERRNVWLMVKYALVRRHERRRESLKFLEHQKEQGGVSAIIAEWLRQEFDSREIIYRERVAPEI